MKTSTRKAIESRLGIKTFNSFVRIDSNLYPLPFVQGNEKLGTSVWHSGTLPTNKTFTLEYDGETITSEGTCEGTCEGCYGTSGHYQRKKMIYYLIMRTKLLREYPSIYFELAKIQLEYEDIKKLRIHSVGDFIPGEALAYYNMLKEFPNIKAWTYTKVRNSYEIDLLDTLPNCNVVKSIIPGFGFNYGHNAYIANVFYYLKRAGKSVYICRCGVDENQHCSDCDGCSDHEYVLFIEHSTGYNASTDYGWNKIIELIENQKTVYIWNK